MLDRAGDRFHGKKGKIQTVCEMAVRARTSFEAARDQIKCRYLPEQVVGITRYNNKLARDIEFHLDGISINQEQEKLIGDISRALTVVRVVFPESHKAATAIRNDGAPLVDDDAEKERQAQQEQKQPPEYIPLKMVRRGDYVGKLAYVARIGITDPDRVRFANSLLEGFKTDFVSLEGEYVKNHYAKKLGEVAFVIGAIFLAVYFLVPVIPPQLQFLQQPFQTYRSFLVMAAAACVGTWLSFLLRRVTLSFADLENLDEDRLNPVIRVLFVIGLTWIIGAFIATDFIQFKVAGAESLRTELMNRGLVAALIGVVCGIAERALASVVSRRSNDLLSDLGSQRASPQSGGTPPSADRTDVGDAKT